MYFVNFSKKMTDKNALQSNSRFSDDGAALPVVDPVLAFPVAAAQRVVSRDEVVVHVKGGQVGRATGPPWRPWGRETPRRGQRPRRRDGPGGRHSARLEERVVIPRRDGGRRDL